MIAKGSLLLVVPFVLAACGSNYADVPDALVDAIKNPNSPVQPDSGALGYPGAPYGSEVGDVVKDLCFVGWRNPKADAFDPDKTGKICIDEYYDPSGTRNKLLLINSGAVWCVACRVEYGGSGDRPSLSAHLAARESKGFRVMGTIYQDAAAEPATTTDASLWARTYDLSFPYAVDVDHAQFGLFTKPNIAPYNLLIDTRSMKIVLGLAGDEPATLYAAVDDFLAKNAGP
jgi:hypothetical protein